MSTGRIAELTTAQLARRTGVPAGTLRMWEARHDFPRASRLASGHRRYSEADAEAVGQVVRLREQGLSLGAAIARARSDGGRSPPSIFAGLRSRRPDLQPVELTKLTLLDLTRAVEDEYCARAAGGVLVASFQRASFYRQAQRRWRELARGARLAVALADFEAVHEARGAPVEVPVDRTHPLAREWALVVDAPGARACLAGWEQPADSELPDARRRFEVLWTVEPDVVRAATTVAVELIDDLAPPVARKLSAGLDDAPGPSPPELRSAATLVHRMVGYLGARLDAAARTRS